MNIIFVVVCCIGSKRTVQEVIGLFVRAVLRRRSVERGRATMLRSQMHRILSQGLELSERQVSFVHVRERAQLQLYGDIIINRNKQQRREWQTTIWRKSKTKSTLWQLAIIFVVLFFFLYHLIFCFLINSIWIKIFEIKFVLIFF